MKIAVFSTKAYDRVALEQANQGHGHELTFLEPRLTEATVELARGFDAVCPFVNDELTAGVIATLAANGTRLLALRSAGFNHVDLAAAAQHGITVTGRVKSGGAGFEAELVRRESRPLSELVHALGKQSDNFVAEMLLKAMGRSGSEAGTSQKGAQVIQDMLRRLGALTPGTRILNGSGLYDANRISAFTLTRVLAHARKDPKVGPELLASLAIGGTDGTLASRLAAFKSARTVRAKTGTLASVVTLAGYVLGPTPLAFAFLLNGVGGKVAESRRRIDIAVTKLAT